MPKKEDVTPETSDYELDKLLARRFGSLYRGVDGPGSGAVYALHFRWKVEGYWQAVAKQVPLGRSEFEVCFGRGKTLSKAIKDLNAAIANSAWRPDRPYVGD